MAFIARAKASRAFGDVDWDKPIWDDVALSKTKRATAGRLGGKGLFFLSGKGGERGSGDIQPLRPPFVDFVKALVRRQEERAPRFVDNHRVMIRACRYLHDGLEPDGYDPCRLTNAHFDRAANAALAAESASTAYSTGKALVGGRPMRSTNTRSPASALAGRTRFRDRRRTTATDPRPRTAGRRRCPLKRLSTPCRRSRTWN